MLSQLVQVIVYMMIFLRYNVVIFLGALRSLVTFVALKFCNPVSPALKLTKRKSITGSLDARPI